MKAIQNGDKVDEEKNSDILERNERWRNNWEDRIENLQKRSIWE